MAEFYRALDAQRNFYLPVLDGKKARGYCVKPWSLLVEKSSSGGVVPLLYAARIFFQGQGSFTVTGGDGD